MRVERRPRYATALVVAVMAAISIALPALAQSPGGAGDGQRQMLARRMVLVPAGEFTVGTDRTREKPIPAAYGLQRPAYENEEPRRRVHVDAFYIDRFEVTRIEYRQFLRATQPAALDAKRDAELKEWSMYPVVNVTWLDADRYCRWKGVRLPTEEEWEKAARGTDGRRFPWGDEYADSKTNMQQGGLAQIGSFPEDTSPYGAMDMAGSVTEWTSSWYTRYPGNTNEDPDYGETLRVVRGGSWGGTGHYNVSYFGRTAYRGPLEPTQRFENLGFRCALSANEAKR